MKLPFLTKKKEDTGFYLALLLTDEKATAVILHEQLGKVKIIGSRDEFFSTPLDHVQQEELIEVVDKALSRAEESLPPSVETHDTVFGVKETWVEEDTKKIKKTHLAQLKKVCENLDLTPIGFMVIGEAVTHLIQEEEGAPVSAILAEIGKTGVNLTLLRGGKKLEAVRGPFKEFSPPMTVDMLLRHFTVPVLPARLIIYDAEGSEKLSQQFITHQWSKGLPFLHVPQITVLPAGFEARAVAFGAASQLGFELVGIDKELPKAVSAPEEPEKEAEEEPSESETVTETDEETLTETVPPLAKPVKADNFGFVTDKDITELHAHSEEKETDRDEEAPEKPQSSHPVHLKHEDEESFHPTRQHHTQQLHIPEDEEIEDEDAEEEESREKKAGPLAFLSNLRLPTQIIKNKNLLTLGKKKKVLLPVIVIGLLICLIVGFTLFYLYNVEATVSLSMRPNMVNQTTKTVFSTDASSDFSKNVIATKSISVSVDGEASTNATGKKDVGEKAKGTVTVFNNSANKVNLTSGTEIKSSTGLTFLLDKDVTVSSASGDIFSGTKPGTTDVSVVAKDIGSEQNLPSNTKFTIGSNASLAAKNDSAFSGGTKKTVTVVSKDDLAKLRADLPKSLQSKAKAAIEQKASSDQTVLPYFATNSLEKATYDKKVDEEAKTVKLKATVVFDGMAFSKTDLEDYAKSVLKRDQSDDVNFADKTIKAEVKDAKETNTEDIEATVAIEAGVLPKLDTTEVAEGLQGKSYGEAKDKLANLPQVATSEITFTPGIPLLPQLFPSLPKKIKVVITSE